MFKEGKIGIFEGLSIFILSITSKMYFASPSQLVALVGNAGWIETIISGATAIIAFSLIYLLMKRFDGMDIVSIFQKVFGTVIGGFFIVILSLYTVFYIGISLREFADIMNIIFLPLTPTIVILSSFLLCLIILCYLGLESIARTAAFFFIWIILGYLAIIILPFQSFKLYRLFPIFGYGMDKVFYYGLQRSSAWSEIIMLTIIINSFQGIKNFKKVGYLSLIISTFLITIGVFSYVLGFRYYIANEPVSGLFHLSQAINYGRFFQRLESIFVFIWVISALINLCISLYFCCTLYAKTFKLTDYKPVLIAISIIILAVSMLPPNFTWISYTGILIIRTYSWIPYFGMPILALIVAMIRNKRSVKHA